MVLLESNGSPTSARRKLIYLGELVDVFMQESIDASYLRELAQTHGLALIGFRPLGPLIQDRGHLYSWQEQGYAGTLGYMQRPADLFDAPAQILASQGTIISCAVAYDRGPRKPLPPEGARVARYAWGRDYHKVLKKRLQSLAQSLIEELPQLVPVRVFTDAVPLLERAYARESGLGFVGKNTMLITPKTGSFTLLGEILLGLGVVNDSTPSKANAHCGSCSRCQSACPTKAFPRPYVLDARKCISYLTIEKRGMLTEDERLAIGEWVFGCDICQEVCPFNHRAMQEGLPAQVPELSAQFGVGASLSLSELFQLKDDAEFLARFAGTALMRAKREGLLRNGLAVAVNRKCVALASQISRLAVEDTSPVVRATAWWALRRLAQSAIDKGLKDPSEIVREEVLRLLEV